MFLLKVYRMFLTSHRETLSGSWLYYSFCLFPESFKYFTSTPLTASCSTDRNPNNNSSYSVEIRWVLGSDSLDEADPEDDLLEKNNNDTQDALDRVASCVRFILTIQFDQTLLLNCKSDSKMLTVTPSTCPPQIQTSTAPVPVS